MTEQDKHFSDRQATGEKGRGLGGATGQNTAEISESGRPAFKTPVCSLPDVTLSKSTLPSARVASVSDQG